MRRRQAMGEKTHGFAPVIYADPQPVPDEYIPRTHRQTAKRITKPLAKTISCPNCGKELNRQGAHFHIRHCA